MRKFANMLLIIVLIASVSGLLIAAIGAENDRSNMKKIADDMGISLSREDIPRLVGIIRIWKLVDELGLKEEQMIQFLPKFKELDKVRFRHNREKSKAVTELRKLLEANTAENQIKTTIDEFRSSEMKFLQREQQLEEALNSYLTVSQQAKYIVFQDDYWRDMERLIRNLKDLSDLKEQQLKPQPVPLRKKE